MRELLLMSSLLCIVGCSTTTETGYEPRRLGDSAAVERGYYATPFTPEKRAAEQERVTNNNDRKPGYSH